MPNKTNESLGIYKLPINCEPIIKQLNQKHTINKNNINHSILTSIGILANKTKTITIKPQLIESQGIIHIKHRSRKKITIKPPHPPHFR